MSCQDFIRGLDINRSKRHYETFAFYEALDLNRSLFFWMGKLTGSTEALVQAIKEPCAAPLRKQDAIAFEEVESTAQEVAARQEAAARERDAQAAKRVADFRNGILVAVHAAEDPDPFASIRGDFDLSALDSRQWKTSFTLPGSEKCVLLKAPAPTPAVGSVWTLACMFRASGDRYEDIVRSVQSVLNLPYQPDEQALNVNQVFFADPSRPAWRLFVTRLSEATVGVSVVAMRLTGAASAVPNPAMFPGVPTKPQTEPTVHDEVCAFGEPA